MALRAIIWRKSAFCVLKDALAHKRVPKVKPLKGTWMNNMKTAPFARFLIVHDEVWFGQKRLETIGNAEFLRTVLGIFTAARTPAIKNRAFFFQFPYVAKHVWHRDTLGADAPHEGVVHVYVNNGRLHLLLLDEWEHEIRVHANHVVGVSLNVCVIKRAERL